MYIYIYIYILWNISIHKRLPARLSESSASCLGFASDCSQKNRNTQKYPHVAFRHDEFINSKNCARTDSCSGASPSFPAFPGKSQGSEDFTSEGHGKKPGWIIKIGETAGQKITLGIPRKIPVVSISFDLLKKIKEGAGTLEEMFDDFRTKIKGGSWMTHVSRFSRRVNYDSL